MSKTLCTKRPNGTRSETDGSDIDELDGDWHGFSDFE